MALPEIVSSEEWRDLTDSRPAAVNATTRMYSLHSSRGEHSVRTSLARTFGKDLLDDLTPVRRLPAPPSVHASAACPR